jgi:hypothetical protein
MATMARLRTRARVHPGQGLVEFALVLPIVLLILSAAVDVGRLFSAYVTIENAAKEGALFGGTNAGCTATGPGCVDPNNTTWHVTSDLNGLTPSPTIAVSCSGTPCTAGSTYQVSVTYPFTFFTPFASMILGSPFNLGADASSVVLNTAVVGASPTLGVSKTSTTALVTAADQVVPYSYLVSNSGNVLVTGISVTDNNVDHQGSQSGVTCPSTSLAAGASMTCTAQHTVTAADMSSGANLTNVVTVTSANAPTVSASLSIPIQAPPSCTNPTVTIAATPLSGSGSFTVTFTGTSTGGGTPQSWLWTFDDGTSSNAGTIAGGPTTYTNTITHTYSHTGNGNNTQYASPSLTVQTGATCSTTQPTSNRYITINP